MPLTPIAALPRSVRRVQSSQRRRTAVAHRSVHRLLGRKVRPREPAPSPNRPPRRSSLAPKIYRTASGNAILAVDN